MPLPAGVFNNQPLSIEPENISMAVEKVFEQTGVVLPREKVQRALDASGMDVESLAMHLATLITTAKDSTKLKAVLSAFELQGIATRQDLGTPSAPSINFHIHPENGTVNLQALFNPERS